ncbi:Vacuolar amino acid transporter 1 [Spathaspora sp. JA1]|nr:Vacuolar amino acid transporter 1 [Spathaspora sp. JA1]
MSTPPAEARSIPHRERRRSLLDIGGPNSINNFASSYTRAQQYIGSTLIEQGGSLIGDISREASIGHEQEEEPGEFVGRESFGRFNFPATPITDEIDEEAIAFEETPLLSPQISRISTKRGSFSIITGNSTVPQTVFNSVNTLVGIAMLTLPFGFKLSGWLFGTILMLVTAIFSNITAKYLGRILRSHPHLSTYGDIAHAYGGPYFSYFVTFFFIFDLTGASLTLIILFADSFSIIWPHIRTLKMVIVGLIFLMSLLPLHILSIFSLLGILATMCIIIVIVACGFLSDQQPGSLIFPEATSMFPPAWKNLLFSLGIFMAPWGGHPVFPELYRDMRHPDKFSRTSNVSFSVTFILDILIGILGYLMFGGMVDDSIVKSIMNNPHYPSYINSILCIIMGILPISKLPLVTKPIITSYENILGLTPKYVIMDKEGKLLETYGIKRILCRAIFFGLLLALALLFTSFGKLVAFLGSAICFTVCLALPLLFYLKLNRNNIGPIHAIIIKIGIVVFLAAAIIGTYASIAMETPK